jgi:hypothetical protein
MDIIGVISNLKEVFHGKGYLGYSSVKSQEVFLKSLVKISDKLFWSPLAAIAALIINDGALAAMTIVGCGILTVIAMCIRHSALAGFDEIESRKKAKETSRKFRRSKCI